MEYGVWMSIIFFLSFLELLNLFIIQIFSLVLFMMIVY